MLEWYEQGLLIVSLMLLMLGVGASLEPKSFDILRTRPQQLFLGVFSQFGVMPFAAFGLAWMLDATPEVTLALVMLGATPGGSTSNIFCYYARANIPLSIGMTIVSSVGAMVMMPLILWLYLDTPETQGLVIPFKNIIISLGGILTPIGFGLLIRFRYPALGERLERLGSRAGYLAALLMIVIWGPNFVAEIRWEQAPLYLSFVVMFFTGIGGGWLTGWIAQLPGTSRRAIALETGIQNCPLTLTIMTLSFPATLLDTIAWIPVTYGALSVGMAGTTALAFNWLNRDQASTSQEHTQ